MKPLFDTVLFEFKFQDNESRLIWIDCLHMLLGIYNVEHSGLLKEAFSNYDLQDG